MSKNTTLATKRGIRAGHREKRVDSTVKKGKFQAKEVGQAQKTSLEKVGESISRCVYAKAVQKNM